MVKLAPSLSQKAVNPSSTDRQSVPLMLRVFNDKTTCALSVFATRPGCCSEAINDTKVFIEIIVKLWKMLNVKHPLKGRNLRDENCDPIRSVDDHQVKYFDSVVLWLDVWEAMIGSTRTGILTRETMSALRHTLKAMSLLCKYLLEVLKFKYVSTGKFQTDYLEYRFSQYRRLSGTNFHISVREIMESEKKLKLMSILTLKSASLGRVSVAQFSSDCSAVSEHETSDSALALAAQPFASVALESESVEVSDNDMKVLVYIAGYVGRKAKLASTCDACIW